MPERLIVAIDLGTSGPKVSLFSLGGKLVATQQEAVPLLLFPGGGAEQEPDAWWAAICTCAQRLLNHAHVAPEHVVAVATTAQWGGTVAVDAAGHALGNAIIWADSRGAPHVNAVTRGWPTIDGYGAAKALRWIRRTGGLPTRGDKDAIAHILFLRHERPELYRQAHKFLDIKDYLNARLTGRIASSPDTQTLLWATDTRDIHHVTYDDGLLAVLGLDRALLPDLLPATSILAGLTGAAALELGLLEGTPVVVGTGDIMAAAVGSGAVAPGEAHIHVGTSSWLSFHLARKQTDVFHNMGTLPSALPGLYLLTNEQDLAGGALVWLRDNLVYADDLLETSDPGDAFARFDALAQEVAPGSDGLIFTPWLNGERSPVEDLTLGGGFHNLRLGSTRAHMVRAVLEGVALNLRWLQPHVERMARHRLDPIRMVGGGAKSEVWCRIFADVLDRTILQVEHPQAASGRGAALLAAVALGAIKVEELGEAVAVRRSFAPIPENVRTYSTLFSAFEDIYRRTHRIHARLNG